MTSLIFHSYHFAGEGQPVLDWAIRVKVAAGSARGLAYLHEDCNYLHFSFWILMLLDFAI